MRILKIPGFLAIIISYFFSTTNAFGEKASDEELLKSLGFGFVLDSKALEMKQNTRGHYELGLGLAVDASCFKIYPKKEIAKEFQKMLTRGLACMKREEKGESVKRDLESFLKLLSNRSNLPKIECDKPLPDVAFAVGSSPGTSRNHPYIYLSRIGNEDFKKKPAFFQGVVFHELLHNIRYFHHPDDLEVTSACEECCFGEMTGEKKAEACKVCSGVYDRVDDPEYLRSLLRWDGRFYGRLLVEEQFAKAFKEPGILKEAFFAESLSAFLVDIKAPLPLKESLGLTEKILAYEYETVEKEMDSWPKEESSYRMQFLYFRLMAQAAKSQNNLFLERAFLEKASLARKKYL